MKIFIVLSVFISFCAGKVIYPTKSGESLDQQRYAWVPDRNGNVYLADLKEMEEIAPRFDAFRNILLFIYTRNNMMNPDVISNGAVDNIANSRLDKTKPVKLVIHGWINDFDSEINAVITSAFLKVMDVNVISVDWSYGGSTILYPIASGRVPRVGEFVAHVVDWLVNYGVPLSNIHIIGHSLGAHAAGFTGRNVKSGKVPYITGLDPALPLWNLFYDGISKEDGDYVEIIHSDGGSLGIMDDVGHTDFYPNGGRSQPGCLTGICDHARAYIYFADSLDHELFVSKQCNSVREARRGNCHGSTLHMGASRPKTEHGIYHCLTNSRQPFYQG